MRRILAQNLLTPSMLTVKPDEDAKILRIPNPHAANSGKIALRGHAERVQLQQDLLAKAIISGDLVDYDPDVGGQYLMASSRNFKGPDGTYVTDSYQWMGEQTPKNPARSQSIAAATGSPYEEVSGIHMHRLERAQKVTATRGYAGMLVYGENNTAGNAFLVRVWRLITHVDFAGDTGGERSYEWDHDVTCDIETYDPDGHGGGADFTELPDGSIVLACISDTSVEETMRFRIYKSYDHGGTWSQIYTSTIAGTMGQIAVGKIGNRILVGYINSGTVGGFNINVIKSDDGGVSWETAATLARGSLGICYASFVNAQDGTLYLIYSDNTGVNTDQMMVSTADGINWSAPVKIADSYESAVVQRFDGSWNMWSVDAADPQILYHNHLHTNAPMVLWGENHIFHTAGGSGLREVAAEEFLYGGFVDVAIIDNSSSNERGITIYRTAMWSGIVHSHDWNNVWSAYCYPASSDPDPHITDWTKTVSGSGRTSTLTEDGLDGNYRALQIINSSGSYLQYGISLPANAYTTGFVVRFELRVGSGKAIVAFSTENGDDSVDMSAEVEFTTTQIRLWDTVYNDYRVTHAATNDWSPADWNDYILVVKGNTVQLYRAPSGTYKEFANFELVFDQGCSTGTGLNPGNALSWGINDRVKSTASESWWKSVFALKEHDDLMLDWDFSGLPAGDLYGHGRKCHPNPAGCMCGFGLRWAGSHVIADDQWDVETSGLYAAENVLVTSPSVQWRSPMPAAQPCPAAQFIWTLDEDLAGNDRSFVADGIAVFGRNWLDCKLEAGYTGHFNTVLDTSSEDVLYARSLAITSVKDNFLSVTLTPSDGNPVPGEYASNAFRNWYVKFTSGTLSGYVYRILDNHPYGTAAEHWETAITHFFALEANVEDLGAIATDTFVIFSDRFFYKFQNTVVPLFYPRQWKLTITASRTSPSENQLRLGTVVMGRLHVLPDDEWASEFVTEPNMSVQRSRTGVASVSENGQAQRSLRLSYSGVIDRGMGIDPVSKFLAYMGHGKWPAAWIDDGSAQDANHHLCHHEPLLVRAVGGFSQSRAAYNASAEQQAGSAVTFKRNVLDVTGVVLEEIV